MISAPPTSREPAHRDLEGQKQQSRTSDDRQRAPDDPANGDLARRLREPALPDDVLFEYGIELGDGLPELEQFVGFDVVARPDRPQPAHRELLGRAHGPATVARPLRLDDLVA